MPLGAFWLTLAVLVLAACVPSPTATPPRQTPFPTLPAFDGTATPELVATGVFGTPAATAEITAAPTITTVASGGQMSDPLPPLVQMTVQDPELPVSADQPVALNVLAADNTAILRLDLYDNNVLFAQAPVIVSSPVYSNQFTWKTAVPGKHTLRAVAYDTAGNASIPAQIELSVINNNRAPNVMITSPWGIKDAELGAPILIQGVATDDVAVTRMDLIVDNQLVTFVKPAQPEGVTPFAVAIPWTPMTTGSHNIVLRAYDNQNQSDDSLRYTIRVFHNQSPVVTASSETSTLVQGDVLVVHALALANNGIARLELYLDAGLADAVNSPTPSQQTAMQANLSAADLATGNHSYFVRAYDVTGITADTSPATIQVVEGAPRVILETPAPQPSRTLLPPPPTGTPEIDIPGPPTIELGLTNAPVILPTPAKIQIIAHGTSELDSVELWVRAPGETLPRLVLEEIVKGATDKTLTFEWNAPQAGVVDMVAWVKDSLNQSRVSSPLRFAVQAPPAPTPVPQGFDFARTWFAESPASRFQVTFTPIGRALRGSFVETRTGGQVLTGRVIGGAVNDKRVFFGVEFTAEPSQPAHTLTFDCSFNARPPVLTCNYTNENDERGSSVFQPLAQ